MQTQFFYDTFKNYNQDELFNIVLAPEDFQSEAVIVARQIVSEKNWTNDLKKRLEEAKKTDIIEQEIYEQEIKEKAEYYKNVLEFKNDRNSFEVRIADIPKFEAALNDNGIAFFREDKNIGAQLDSYPTQTYFFRNENTEQVDEITKNFSLVTEPYADIKPFFGFEIKVVLVVIALTLLLLLFFKLNGYD